MKHRHVTTALGGSEDAGAPGGRVEVNDQSHQRLAERFRAS